ncbi:MAG: hypothetical protein FJX59_04835 [Alphaproteobacteria bacterium]|nr:hypothetical protein [Alphaproteobacteria bacterium]
MDETALSRRAMAGLAALTPLLVSKPVSADEQANIAFVTKFCDDWSSKDVEKLIPYLAPEIEYHVFEGGPVVKGIDQFRAQMGGFMKGMREITWETKRSAAIGDLVINERIDHFIQPEGSTRPDNHFHIAGVFIVRGGKIVYWKDWRMPGA